MSGVSDSMVIPIHRRCLIVDGERPGSLQYDIKNAFYHLPIPCKSSFVFFSFSGLYTLPNYFYQKLQLKPTQKIISFPSFFFKPFYSFKPRVWCLMPTSGMVDRASAIKTVDKVWIPKGFDEGKLKTMKIALKDFPAWSSALKETRAGGGLTRKTKVTSRSPDQGNLNNSVLGITNC